MYIVFKLVDLSYLSYLSIISIYHISYRILLPPTDNDRSNEDDEDIDNARLSDDSVPPL